MLPADKSRGGEIMKRLMVACAALAVTGCVAPGLPIPGLGGMTSGMATNSAMTGFNQSQAQAENMMAAQAAAERAAVRPGDEALSCDALQTELATVMKDPAFQAAIASSGAAAQAQMDQAKAAQATAAGLGATSIATGIASSFIPGMGWLAGAAMQAQVAEAQAKMPAADRARAQMIGDVTSMLPTMYRGQRIHELATAKKCAFVSQASPS
jgi:hypothetical protein